MDNNLVKNEELRGTKDDKVASEELKQVEKQVKKELAKQQKREKVEQRKADKRRKKLDRLKSKRSNRTVKVDKRQAKLLRQLEQLDVDVAEDVVDKSTKRIRTPKRSKKGVFNALSSTVSGKKYLIIDIREDYTYIYEVSVEGSKAVESKRVLIYAAVQVETPDGAYSNGALVNVKKLAIAIVKALFENGIKTKDTILVSGDTEILQRQVDNFQLQKNAQHNANLVRGRAVELFPVNLDNYILDYKVMSVVDDAESDIKFSVSGDLMEYFKSKKKKVNKVASLQVVAFPIRLQELLIQLSEICALNLMAIDFAGNGMLNLINREYRDSNKICIEISDNYTTYYTVSNGVVVSQSKINSGYSNILKNFIATHVEGFGQSVDAIWDTLTRYKLLEEPQITDETLARVGIARGNAASVMSLIDDLRFSLETIIDKARLVANEASKSLSGESVTGIDIICVASSFPNLTEDIEMVTGLSVTVKREFDWVYNSSDDISVLMVMHGVGVVLNPANFRSVKQIKASETSNRLLDNLAILMVFIGAAGVAALILLPNKMYKEKFIEKQSIDEQIEAAKEAELIATRKEDSENAVTIVRQFDTNVSSSDQLYNIIIDLEQIMPRNAVVTSLVSNDTFLSIVVYVDKRIDAIRLIEGLEQMECFESVTTTGIQSIDTTGENSYALGNYQLAIKCDYKSN